MPALWESSERPMYIKTVWVDGFRHAILTHDDPYLLKLNAKKKRPHSSASCAGKSNYDSKFTNRKFRKTRLSENEDQLGECLKKLNFVINNNRTSVKNKFTLKNENKNQEHIEELNLKLLETESEDELVLKANAQRLNEFDTSRSKFAEMKTVRSNRTARTENNNENHELSERVLQWLDLAGKNDILLPEKETTRVSQPRHSWHDIQKRNTNQQTKFKTMTDFKDTKEKTLESAKSDASAKDKVQTVSGVIDRHDFYVTTPANTIENYARQSRNVKDTPRNLAKKPKEPLNKAKNIEPKTNVQETREKVANEIQAMEKQYADLINKKIIPNYNKQVYKRQVHIFVPTVPKKSVASTATSRTDSLIS